MNSKDDHFSRATRQMQDLKMKNPDHKGAEKDCIVANFSINQRRTRWSFARHVEKLYSHNVAMNESNATFINIIMKNASLNWTLEY